MAKDKFTPIDPSIVDQTDDESAAPASSSEPVDQGGAQPTSPLADPSTVTAASTSPLQRTPVQQAQVSDAVAREQEGQNRQALVKAATAIREKYAQMASKGDGERGAAGPDPASPEGKILALYDQEYGQGNLDKAQAQAQAENIPTALKPLVAGGEGLLDAVDKTGYALGVGGGEYNPTVPGGATGHVTKSVVQFTAGMAAALATFKGQGIFDTTSKIINGAKVAVAGGLSGAIAQDPHEENLSNLIEQHSALAAPIADYLAAKPDDTEAVARMKKFCENAGLGAGTDGLLSCLKLIKLGRAVRAGDRAAAGAIPEAQDEIQKLVHQALSPEDGELLPLGKGEQGLYDSATTVKPAETSLEKSASPAAVSSAQGVKAVAPLPEPPKQLISPESAQKLRASVENHNDLIDGGIHFNFDHLPDKPDALQMLNEVSKVTADAVTEKTGGIQSLRETQDIADMLGAKPAELISAVQRLGASAKEQAGIIVAGKSLMVDLAQQITDQSRVINAAVQNGADTAEAEAKLLRLMNIHADLQANLKGAITGAARATGAGRIDVKEAAQLFSMADGNPAAIAKLVRPLTTGEKVFGVINEWRVNAMLSSVRTLAVKGTADLLNGIGLPAAKVIGGVLHGNMGAIRDGVGTYIGLTKSLGDSFSMARKALNSGQQFLTAGVNELPRRAISTDQGGIIGALVDGLGTVVRMPTRLIGTLDEFSKQMNYRAAVYSQASREGAAKGLTGDSLAQWIEDASSKAFDAQGRGINDQALQYAKEATFTQDLDYGIGKWLQDGANNHPIVRTIVPFVKIPTNLFRQAWAATPGLQWLQKQFAEDMAAGGTRAAAARGKQVIGALAYAQAVNLATSGRITGAGPADPEARKALQATGWQPYSFKVGDKYYSYARLDPFAMPFGLAADFAEAAGQMSSDTADKTAAALATALAHNLTSKTYLGGIIDMMDGLRDPDHKILRVMQAMAGSFIPNTRQFTDILPQTQDPYMRECRTILDGVRKKIPGLSQNLAPSRNLFGEPIATPAGFGPDTLSPFYESQGTSDPTLKELTKFPKGFAMPAQKVGNVDLTKVPSKEGGYDAYDRLLQLNGSVKVDGKNLKDHLQSYIQSDEYQKLTDDGPGYSGSKFEALSRLIGQHRTKAMEALTNENDGVRKARIADRENQKAALTKGPEAVNPLNQLMSALQPH